MAKVRSDKYKNARPKLEVSDLEDGDFLVLTVAAFGEQQFTDWGSGNRTKITPFLEFEETGEKVLWLTPVQVDYLVEVYGDDTDDWLGQPVCVERHAYTFQGQAGENLWVAAPERWPEMLRAAKVAVPVNLRAKAAPEKKKPVKPGRGK